MAIWLARKHSLVQIQLGARTARCVSLTLIFRFYKLLWRRGIFFFFYYFVLKVFPFYYEFFVFCYFHFRFRLATLGSSAMGIQDAEEFGKIGDHYRRIITLLIHVQL